MDSNKKKFKGGSIEILSLEVNKFVEPILFDYSYSDLKKRIPEAKEILEFAKEINGNESSDIDD